MKKKWLADTWQQIDWKIFIPGSAALLLVVILGAVFPIQFGCMLRSSMDWLMTNLKWFYTLVVCLITAFCLWLLFSKYGDIRLGGKDAKPSLKTSTWFTLTLTGTIAVGICFYAVSGPVSIFLDPPAFLHLEGGTPEAVIPTLKYCFLHYGLPPYFLIIMLSIGIALSYYNGKRSLKASDALYPLLGERVNGWIGTVVNTLVMVSLLVCGTNMGLAAIQFHAGINFLTGLDAPALQMLVILFYTGATIMLSISGVHRWMGKLSNFTALLSLAVLLYVLFLGPAGCNRLIGTYFTALGEFAADFIPMITFSDSVEQTGWQNMMTMYYYSWNIAPALLGALFYVSIAYGRTLRQFILVNCILTAGLVAFWYTVFGGTVMFDLLEGSNLYETILQYGEGAATFAFLKTLPGGDVLSIVFLVMAVLIFLTFSDSITFSFPMLFMKHVETDASLTQVPRILYVVIAGFMGALTALLLFVGGYDALCTAMVVLAFPAAILLLLVVCAAFKMLLNREIYDVTYQEELRNRKDVRCN